MNNLNHYFPAARGLKLCQYPPLLPSPASPIRGPGVTASRPLPSGPPPPRIPTSPHPSPLPISQTRPSATHTGPHPHSGLLHTRPPAPWVSPILPSPSSTPTRQAGGSVDPLEQLSGAQLSAEVGVRGLDGLAHVHLAGRRPLQLHGWSRVRSNRAWTPPGHQLGPPPLQRAPSRCHPGPAPRALLATGPPGAPGGEI
nr:MAPK-interacting and spindle-stabilizing protein-like [Globicephala melas]